MCTRAHILCVHARVHNQEERAKHGLEGSAPVDVEESAEMKQDSYRRLLALVTGGKPNKALWNIGDIQGLRPICDGKIPITRSSRCIMCIYMMEQIERNVGFPQRNYYNDAYPSYATKESQGDPGPASYFRGHAPVSPETSLRATPVPGPGFSYLEVSSTIRAGTGIMPSMSVCGMLGALGYQCCRPGTKYEPPLPHARGMPALALRRAHPARALRRARLARTVPDRWLGTLTGPRVQQVLPAEAEGPRPAHAGAQITYECD